MATNKNRLEKVLENVHIHLTPFVKLGLVHNNKEKDFKGFLGTFYNYVKNFNGVGVGVFNVAEKDYKGVGVGVVNGAIEEYKGVGVGVVNGAIEEYKGVGVGVVNGAENLGGVGVGMMNV
ncbi:MAG: hypothetical protein KKG60_02645, partial [Nanoarchaeota archaeon]|nr:hypothetical protein [Nanoarchaeota archaeon]